MASEAAPEGLANMAETAVAVAAGTDSQEGAHMAVASQEGAASPSVPVTGVTTAEEYGLQHAGPARRLCLCRGNCNGRIRHEPGQCGKRSVSDRPLCSSCKAHKGSSLEKTRAPEEYGGAYYQEGVGTSGEGAEGADGQQPGAEGAGAEGVQMEGVMPGQEGAGVTPGATPHHPVPEQHAYPANPRKRSASARDLADAQAAHLKRLNDQLIQQSSALQALQTCYLSLQESLQAVHRQQVMQLQAIQQLQTDIQIISKKD